MNGKLDTIIYNINHDKRFLLSIFDQKNNESLYRFYEATRILKEFGSGENLFEHLNANGHHELRISSHLKNGTGKRKIAETFTVNFAPQVQPDPITTVPKVHETPIIPMENPSLLPAPIVKSAQPDMLSTLGLGAPQVMELMIRKNDADRLTLENSELRADNRTLKEQNEKFKEEILKDKYDYEKDKDKKTNTHALIGQIAGSLPAIMNYIKPNQSEGLGGSQPYDYGSEIKNGFAEGIKQIDDSSLMMLSNILNTSSTNPVFSNELIELLKKYKIWQ